MADEQKTQNAQAPAGREPIFMLPGAALALCGLMLAIHLARTFVLNQDGDAELLTWFALIPVRVLDPDRYLGGYWPLLWSPLTHAFLHANWEHVLINTVWLAVFATPVARRYGPVPVLILFAASAIAGAALFAVTTLPRGDYLVGASGAVAGLTGAAVRFMFQPMIITRHPESGEIVPLGRRLASLGDLIRNPQPRFFIVVWVVLNAAVPLLPMLMGTQVQIAWAAHLGGFFAGLFLVPVFERRPK